MESRNPLDNCKKKVLKKNSTFFKTKSATRVQSISNGTFLSWVSLKLGSLGVLKVIQWNNVFQKWFVSVTFSAKVLKL